MKTEPSERPSPGRARHPAPRRPPDRSGTYVRAVAVVFLVVSLLTVGTVGFHLIEGWSYFKALYGTLMTVSTIGAEPENQLSETGQIFNVTLVFLGVGVVGFAMATLTHAVIESELGTFFGRRRMEKEISRLKDHIIICGAGRVGRRVASEVAARDIPLVIVEQDAVKARWAQEQTFLVIIGDATSEAVLRQARIEHARGLASAVTSDAQNVYIILTARGMAPELPIIARASEDAAESKMLRAGATTVISPYSYAGHRMARTLVRPHVQRFLDLALSSLSDGDLDLQIEEVHVAEESELAGSSLRAADMRNRLGVIILAIRGKDGRLNFNPRPDQTIS
ncbi:MAG: potassium channel protein, partial [Acidobacteria bacterium]|nr:potassium channel protein [Acidobacteriota bacterium]